MSLFQNYNNSLIHGSTMNAWSLNWFWTKFQFLCLVVQPQFRFSSTWQGFVEFTFNSDSLVESKQASLLNQILCLNLSSAPGYERERVFDSYLAKEQFSSLHMTFFPFLSFNYNGQRQNTRPLPAFSEFLKNNSKDVRELFTCNYSKSFSPLTMPYICRYSIPEIPEIFATDSPMQVSYRCDRYLENRQNRLYPGRGMVLLKLCMKQ